MFLLSEPLEAIVGLLIDLILKLFLRDWGGLRTQKRLKSLVTRAVRTHTTLTNEVCRLTWAWFAVLKNNHNSNYNYCFMEHR